MAEGHSHTDSNMSVTPQKITVSLSSTKKGLGVWGCIWKVCSRRSGCVCQCMMSVLYTKRIKDDILTGCQHIKYINGIVHTVIASWYLVEGKISDYQGSYNIQEKQDQWHSTTHNTSYHYISCCTLCVWEATQHNTTTNTLWHYDIRWNCSQWLCIIWNTSSHSLRTNG